MSLLVVPSTGVFVKICGVTTESDALLCVAMGADAIGFNFVNGSSRQIAPQRAGDIAKRLPPEVLTVAIFRNHAPKRVVEIVNREGLGAAQLHGNESIEDTHWIAERVPRTMKAFVAGSEAASRAGDWGTNPILLDAAEGGSGKAYDYRIARQVPPGYAVVLAGGLHTGNVEDAILAARPWGVDVASGVESAPGTKDPKLVADFVRLAKAVELAPLPVSETEGTGPGGEPGVGELTLAPCDWQSDTGF